MKKIYFLFYCFSLLCVYTRAEDHSPLQRTLRSADHSLLQRALRSAKQAPPSLSICHEDERRYEDFVRQQARKQDDTEQSSTRQLFEWCKKDTACCAAYYMNGCGQKDERGEYTDFETFRYLTSHWHTPNEPLTSLLDAGGYCGHRRMMGSRNVDEDEADKNETEKQDPLQRVLKYAWLVEMRLQTYEHSLVHCGENEHFVYSPSDSEGRCICNAHASDECHTIRRHRQRDPWNYSMAAIIVAAVAATVLFILYIINMLKQFPVYDYLMKDDDPSFSPQAVVDTSKRDRFLSILHQRQNTAANR